LEWQNSLKTPSSMLDGVFGFNDKLSFQFSESRVFFSSCSRDSYDSWFTIFAFFEQSVIHESTAVFRGFARTLL